jgi:hypothetical protein
MYAMYEAAYNATVVNYSCNKMSKHRSLHTDGNIYLLAEVSYHAAAIYYSSKKLTSLEAYTQMETYILCLKQLVILQL